MGIFQQPPELVVTENGYDLLGLNSVHLHAISKWTRGGQASRNDRHWPLIHQQVWPTIFQVVLDQTDRRSPMAPPLTNQEPSGPLQRTKSDQGAS